MRQNHFEKSRLESQPLDQRTLVLATNCPVAEFMNVQFRRA